MHLDKRIIITAALSAMLGASLVIVIKNSIPAEQPTYTTATTMRPDSGQHFAQLLAKMTRER